MPDQTLDDTQPTPNIKTPPQAPVSAGSDFEAGQTQTNDSSMKVTPGARTQVKRLSACLWTLLAMALVSLGVAGGAYAGYWNGSQSALEIRAQKFNLQITEQYMLGLDDLKSGRYDAARQRFEYVFGLQPDYPGLAEKMAAVYTILYATATPTLVTQTPTNSPTPTLTLTPTPDLRPVQERWQQAVDYFQAGDWSAALESLIALRKADEAYQVTQVDDMLYFALRQRGVNKIYQESNLEGGIYDLSLAENFGPLDLDALVARNNARMYLYGSSFWEAYPELAVYYFSQVAAAAPYLRDGSGWTATERYRGALIQFGDRLMQEGEWCRAYEQYQLAVSIRSEPGLIAALDSAAQLCLPPTATYPEPATSTATATPTATLEATASSPPAASDTPSPLPPPSETPPPTPSPPPSETPVTPTEPPPIDTPTP